LESNANVRKAVEEGFDFNGLMNGVGLDKTRHVGGHLDYTESVNNMINKAFSLDANKGRKASDILSDVSKQIKSDIKNSKGNINDLYKKK
ncbi:MAG: AHH domain-containing protein, partial [Flammeovirgaceae bacterium]